MHVDSWPTLSRLLDEALELRSDGSRARGSIASLRSTTPFCRVSVVFLARQNRSKRQPSWRRSRKSTGPGSPVWTMLKTTDPCRAQSGPYQILRKLGEGGMGAVWLAQRSDGMLKRSIALKLPRGAWPRAGLAERMARERDILATLNHPNIARLFDAGLDEHRAAVSGA